MGYTSMPLLAAWEAGLAGHRLRSWQDLRDALELADADTRAAAVSLCLELDLDDGRRAYAEALRQEQRYKAHLIRRGGKELAERVGWLSASVREALDAAAVHRAVGEWASRLAGRALGHAFAVAHLRLGWQVAMGPWQGTDPGAEWGRGMAGYDTPGNVAEARVRREAAMAARRDARLAQAEQARASTVQVVADHAARVAEEARRLEAQRVAQREAAPAPPPVPGAPQGGLFAPRRG